MKKLLLASSLSAICLASAAAAEQTGYVGIGVASISAEFTDGTTSLDFSSTDAIVLLGLEVAEGLAVEGEFSTVLADDSLTSGGVTLDVGLKHFGVFARWSFNPGGDFTPFLRAGYVKGTVDVSAAGLTISDDDDGAAIGLGFEAKITENMSLRGDFTYADLIGDPNIIALSTVYRF